MSKKKLDSVLVIIPTMAKPDLVIPCVERVIKHRGKYELSLLVVSNPKEPELAAASKQAVETVIQLANSFLAEDQNKVDFAWLEMGKPAGWVGAVNAGVEFACKDTSNLPDKIVIMNDDALVTPLWLDGLTKSFKTRRVLLPGELAGFGQSYFISGGRPVSGYGTIGMVGPVSNNVAGGQKIDLPGANLQNGNQFTVDSGDLLDEYSVTYAEKNGLGTTLAADFISGFLVMYSKECLLALLENCPEGKNKWFLNPIFGVGGYDDNDVAVRAEHLGFRKAISIATYVHHLGHQTLDVEYPEMARGLTNIANYLETWEEYTQRDQKMIGCYRVKLSTLHDVILLRNSIDKAAQLLDGIAMLWTGSPAEVTKSWDWQPGVLDEVDQALIAEAASASNEEDLVNAGKKWLEAILATHGEHLTSAVGVWNQPFNERDERNASVDLAYTLDPDWIMSIDHDEVIEDRFTRWHIERLMKHPDPNVQTYDIGWFNHWDSPRLYRTDPPWSAPEYASSMRGFRIWRTNKVHARKIMAGNQLGLHCGNCPDFDLTAKRIAGLRMRHYGYIRPEDRFRKYQNYKEIDPNPDSVLTQGGAAGGSYDHLVNEEGMKLAPYKANNGIGFNMLIYKEDQAIGLARHLSDAYSLCDRLVLTWTGPEGTKPSGAVAAVAKAYGAEWVFKPFEGDLSVCRNAGLDKLREYSEEGISWCFTMDDDEYFESSFSAGVALRRMAEVSDSWGWMFRFRNYRANGQWNWSESERFFRVDPQGVMRWHGRVHETVEKSNRYLIARGVHPQVRYAPFAVNHFGLAADPEQMQKKLTLYTEMLVEEIKDNPAECPSWVSLGLQYGNDDREEEMLVCMERAAALAKNEYLPFKELATVYGRRARAFMEEAVTRLSDSHPYKQAAMKIVKDLADAFPPQPKTGHGNAKQTAVPDTVDLQELLDWTSRDEEKAKKIEPLTITKDDSKSTIRT